jgi:hypothetical protein
VAEEIGLCGVGEKGLDMVLDDGVGAAWRSGVAVDKVVRKSGEDAAERVRHHERPDLRAGQGAQESQHGGLRMGGARVVADTARERRMRLLANAYFLVVFAGIGGLQMYHVDAGPLTDWGADLFGPPCLYIAFRSGRWRLGPTASALTVFGGCFAWEWAQRWDLSGTPLFFTRGRFDSVDVAAYALGVLGSWLLDVYWFGRRAAAAPSEALRIDQVCSGRPPRPPRYG